MRDFTSFITLTPDQFRRVREVFEAALACPVGDRARFVADACAGDTVLVTEVERMLAAEAGPNSLFDGHAASPAPLVRRLASSDSIPVGGFTPGTVLGGRYRVIGLLGRGGMGEVYRADDLKLGQTVALKFLPPELAVDPVRRERFFAEVRITRQLSHPNICRVYDIEEVNGLHFLSMEYVDGEDLASLLKRIGHLSTEKALDIARQLVAGVAAAHGRGVLHRDLKPANIMLDGRGRVRITDFGLAMAAVDVEASDASGTPAYMAPEQLAGKGASVRSDLYGLGLVLYESLTGTPAFRATTLAELRDQKEHQILRAPSDVRPGIDPALERSIMRCLHRDPQERPSSATQLALALPGGDPLAAALAAGETPSPELVAASGAKVGLSASVASTLVIVTMLAVAAGAWLNERSTLFPQVGPGKPPEVLVERARELIRQTGYGQAGADTAFGYSLDRNVVRYVSTRVHGTDRWNERSAADALTFWFVQSSRPLGRPATIDLYTAPPPDPPAIQLAGDVRVFLTVDGQLKTFEAIPAQAAVEARPPVEADWKPLFALSASDEANWRTAAPLRTPVSFADTRMAWEGTLPRRPNTPVRIEAASYLGKPVSFEIIGPWAGADREPLSGSSAAEIVRTAVDVLMFILCVTAGPFVARHNLRLGRGDRVGAIRIASFVAIVETVRWIAREHHVAGFGEAALIVGHLSRTLYLAVLLWVLYIALEPFVRRRWPNTLVSWTRMLAGNWRDPLIGRDVLIGCAVGAVAADLYMLTPVLPAWFGYDAGATILPPDVFLAPGSFIAGTFGNVNDAVFNSVVFLFVLTLVRTVVSDSRVAALIWVIMLGTWQSLQNVSAPWWLTVPPMLAAFFLMYILLTQVGWVAVTIGRFVGVTLLLAPMTFDRSVWYADVAYASLGVLMALTLYGAWASNFGQGIRGSTSFNSLTTR